MNAKEMFEELGYKRSVVKFNEETQLILYEKKDLEIQFDVKCKFFHTWGNEYVVIFKPNLMKAIHQQMKQLGWLDE